MYTPRINPGGNFCGHDPQKPQLIMAMPIGGGGHWLINKAIENVQRFFMAPLRLANLVVSRRLITTRKMRSERREACVLLLSAHLKYLNFSNLWCVIPGDDSYIRLSLESLAEHAGLSYTRAKRAIVDLKRAGYIAIKEVRERQENGEWKSYPAIRLVSEQLFKDLGLFKYLKKARDWASKRDKQRAAKQGLNLTQYIRKMTGFKHKPKQQATTDALLAKNKALAKEVHKLITLNPDLTDAQILATLKNL